MKKIILILLLLPFFAWSQNIVFTEEQNEFMDEFYERIEGVDFTMAMEEFVVEVEDALLKVPYHPNFVNSLLKAKLFLGDYKFATDYCSRLDRVYLYTFQHVLVDACACSYVFSNDFHTLNDKVIPLIKDKDTKELFLAYYYLGTDKPDDFIKYAKTSVTKSFEYDNQMILRDLAFEYLVVLLKPRLDVKDFSKFMKDNEATIFSSDLSIPIYNILISSAVFESDFVMADKIIDYAKKIDSDNYKYLYPVSALLYSHKGEESLAIEKALELEDSDFEKIIKTDNFDKDIFNLYSVSIRELDDFKTRERLVGQAITYFKNREHYRVRFQLYQSLLYASKDIKKARAILKTCESYLSEQNYKDLDYLIRIENEVGKKNPNYRLVDELIGEVLTNMNDEWVKYQRVLYRYKVNYNSKKAVFSINEIVEEIDKLLEKPLGRDTKLDFTRFKILIIGENDREWAMRELEKLPEDEADEIITYWESIENDPQKASDILISNRKDLKDIYDGINRTSVVYINIISLKNR